MTAQPLHLSVTFHITSADTLPLVFGYPDQMVPDLVMAPSRRALVFTRKASTAHSERVRLESTLIEMKQMYLQ